MPYVDVLLFISTHWMRIRTNNVIEKLNLKIAGAGDYSPAPVLFLFQPTANGTLLSKITIQPCFLIPGQPVMDLKYVTVGSTGSNRNCRVQPCICTNFGYTDRCEWNL